MAFSVGEGAVYAVEGSAAAEGAAAAGAAAGAAEGGAASAGAASSSGSFLGLTGVSAAAAKMGVSFGISYAVGSIFNQPGAIAHPDAQTFLGNGYSSMDPIPVLYGRRRIGGSRAKVAVFSRDEAYDSLEMVIIWGEGEVNKLAALYFDGVKWTTDDGQKIYGYPTFVHHLGADDQTAEGALIATVGDSSVWNANCKLSGIAYTFFELGWTVDRYPNGVPTITIDYEGRKVYDPRTGLTAYSRNPSNVIRDYLASERYGCRAPLSMISDDDFSEAADVSDELIGTPDFSLNTLALASGGSGYAARDVIELAGGVAKFPASVVVDTVDGGGAITGWHISAVGIYTTTSLVFSQASVTPHVDETDPLSPIIVSGSGAAFNTATFTQNMQPRYVCDGVVNIDQQPIDNMRGLLTSCRGYLVFSGGKYRLRVDRDETIPNAFWGYDFSQGQARQVAGGAGNLLSTTRGGATGTAFDATGTLQVIAADTLRLDFDPVTLAANGALVEELRTNGIRNSVAAGAVAGSPGTQPTNWNMATTGGVLTRTIVGVFKENGVDYIEVRYQASGAGNFNVVSEGGTITAAANGQTWSHTSYVRVVGGSLTNLQLRQAITGRDSGGVQTEATTTNFTPTGAALGGQRFEAKRTFNNASTVFALGFTQLIFSGAGDVTIRLGLPQTERCTPGGNASSVIRSTGAATTRNADKPSWAIPASVNAGVGGSAFVEWDAADDPAGINARVIYLGDGTDNERVMLYVDHSSDQVKLLVVDGGVTQASLTLGAHLPGQVNRAAITWRANYVAGSLNGAAVVSDTSATMPVMTQFDVGHQNGVNSLNGYIRKVGHIRRSLSDAELVSRSGTPFVLNEDNIVGGWQIALGSKRTRFNRIKGRFFNEDSGFLPDIAVQESTGYRSLDGGIVLEQVIDLPYTTNLYMAQRICQHELKRSRFTLMVSLVADISATCLEVGDVVPVAHATPGWPAAGDPAEGKLFRVVEIELLATDEVRLTLREYSIEIYDTDPLHQVAAQPLTSLPDASSVRAPGSLSVVETVYTTTSSAGVKSKATASWGAAADVWVARGGFYELEYKLASATDWIRISPISRTTQEIGDITPGTYNFRVRAISVTGGRSAYTPTLTFEVLGLQLPPSDVSNFAVQSYSGQAKFTWDKLSPTANNGRDLAVLLGGRIIVRWSPLTVGATWNSGSLVNPDGYPGDTSIGFGPLMTGTYMAKAWNGTIFSVNEATFVVTEALITGLSTIATVTEDPSFLGTKTNVAAVDGGIQLGNTTLIDSYPLIDTVTWIDSLGGLSANGSYGFAGKLDNGSVMPCRLFSTIKSQAFDTGDLIDTWTDIDGRGLMDGAVIEDAEVELQVRATNDDPSGSPSWGPWHALGGVGDYNARAFDFRLDFTTLNMTHNRKVTQLSVTSKH